ncbi:MAG TPA: hypothetical protein VHF06_27885 [Pseudonocardiaceae bacterium]|nr:hypothetical protein [Pseudonocardiaceae bacterium]
MNPLLDTNVLLWWLDGADRLPSAAVYSIRDDSRAAVIWAGMTFWQSFAELDDPTSSARAAIVFP